MSMEVTEITKASRLEAARERHSPRFTLPATPLASWLVHGAVAVLWCLLFAQAFFLKGVFAWGTGVAYVVYDTVLLAFVFWKARRLMRPDPDDAEPAAANMAAAHAETLTMGVVVAAHNEAAALPVTLQALMAQQRVPDLIVIADDGSRDGTVALLTERYGLTDPGEGALSAPSRTHPNLRWLRVPHGGKARALNAALVGVDTDIVMTVDADTLLDAGACAAMHDAFVRRPNLVAATGVLTPVCGQTMSARVLQFFQTYEYIRNFISRFAWMRADGLLLISGAFACFRRDAVVAVGGFDPACLVEDYELIHRLRRYSVNHALGWDVRVIGGAQALTDAPGTLTSFLRQRRRWFAGFLQTQYWYRDMVGNGRYGNLGRLMLPVKAFDTLQPIYGLTAFALLVTFVCEGHYGVVLPVSGIILGKIVIDLGFHLWSVHAYRRWTGHRTGTSLGLAFVAAVLEPFSFQLMRHVGAALGWGHFLTGRQHWGIQVRRGILSGERGTSVPRDG
ncbi:glycosyl transferase [Pandoraea pneumonica]|uniref:Glycosyl transferase n=1 Tax=Pandoraea pneumonica TaxID=2508299 RepID=A0A5E4XPE1_9BURK|nr:glycosyltransferase family 2 protein [Pandoraea pneumonica]VVE38170.1 glycosyl transferase [Pandoraea pneumonica]